MIGVESTNNSIFIAGRTSGSIPSHAHFPAYITQVKIMMFIERKAEKPRRRRNIAATPPSPFSPVNE